jgi:hypothetical protein
MRLLLKLTSAVLVAVGLQLVIGGAARNLVDDVEFMVRIHVAVEGGMPLDSPELLEAADRLSERKTGRPVARLRAPGMPDDVQAVTTTYSDQLLIEPQAWNALDACDGLSDAGYDPVGNLDSPPGHL